LDQETVRSLSAPPAESLAVAVTGPAPPANTVSDGGDTSTEKTGTSEIVTVAVTDFPSLVAVTVTGPPFATARMFPNALFAAAATAATVGSDDVHVTVRPLNTSFAVSLSVT